MAVINCNFTSYTLSRDVEIDVVVPSMTILDVFADRENGVASSHKTGDKYPVMYLLHGYANNRNSWFNYTNVVRYAEERRIAVVTVSAENKFYINNGTDDFKTFISKELREFVTSMFPISDKKEDSYIAGLSMGGYGALYHGLQNEDKFCAIGAFSAAVSVNPTRFASLNVEDPDQYDMYKVAAKLDKIPKLYLACGEKDSLFEPNVKFRDQAIKQGFDVTWKQMPQYAHEWPFWDIQVKEFLDWIPRTDYYSTLPHTGV